jgi:hypothetical protein
MPEHHDFTHRWRAAALALLPMALALAGMCLDERAHLGFSNWRAACRAAGLDIAALITFTVDLLPRAALGALAGVMLVQALGAVLWRGGGAPRAILAAHAGCALGMTAMLLVCAWLPLLPLMLGTEVLLAAGTAALLCHGRNAGARAAVGMRTRAYSGRAARDRKFSGSATSQASA